VAAPGRGDLVRLSFTPHAGHEQAGHPCQSSRRPALVLSPRAYHQKTCYALVCPITGRIEGYPFEVILPEGLPIQGAILTDQIKSVDRHARAIEIVGRAPEATVTEVRNRLWPLLAE
jgi:mRNA interferase MazF